MGHGIPTTVHGQRRILTSDVVWSMTHEGPVAIRCLGDTRLPARSTGGLAPTSQLIGG